MATDDLTYARKKIELARLDESDLCSKIQSLSVIGEQDDLCLLQLRPELVGHVTEGKILTIRGDVNDSAVICTDSSTYELKEAETSNSLLLLPDLLMPNECEGTDIEVVPQNICGIFHTYYELRTFNPSFKKLRSLLERSSYKGKEYEDPNLQEKFTLESLLDTVQSSEEELKNALKEIQALDIDGYIRVLDFDYKFNVFNHIINLVDSRSLSFDKIPKDSVLEALQGLEPQEVLDHCFTLYAKDTGIADENGEKLYALDEDSVCKLYAEILLRVAGKFHLNDFLESWQRSVPEGMTCNVSQLQGLALIDKKSTPNAVFYFPTHNLPENIRERFDKLFKVKEKWTYDEIYPYLIDRASDGNDVKSLLIKYTRESTKDGDKIYSSKW